ncbi:MAG: hypothetical protein HY046_02795 [Acidobacteria bacterium]|nr:hypothetical protein [Acidobacteriota bacterium]
MKSKYVITLMALAMIVSLSGCGGSEQPKETAANAPAAAPAAAPIDPNTTGSVSGSVKLEGTAPKGKRIKMDAEAFCASAHKEAVTEEDIVAGSGGSLANVIVYVKEGLGSRAFDTPRDTVVIDQNGCLYKPHVTALMVNQPLEVTNSDKTTHNIHPVPANNREWNESQAQGAAKISKTFTKDELAIPVKCNVHPWMKSYIAVFKHPYFKVTGADGAFEIKNLPAGDYTLVAWHEKLGESAPFKVTVKAKEAAKADFSFKAPAGD